MIIYKMSKRNQFRKCNIDSKEIEQAQTLSNETI